MLQIIVAMLAGLAVLLVMFGLNSRLGAPPNSLDEQLGRLDTAEEPPEAVVAEQAGARERLAGAIGEWSYSESLAARLTRAGVKLTVTEFLAIKLAAALVVFALFVVATRLLLLSLPLGLLAFFGPDLWLRRKESQRLVQFGLQLPDTLALITASVRAGFSLQQALFGVAKQAPDPTGAEFNRLAQELRLGTSLMEALENLARRVKSDDMDLLVSVFSIQSRVGGNLADILETVAGTMRERVRLRREVQVLTSMQRMSGYVLGLLPLGLAVVLFLINPTYMLGMFEPDIFLAIPIGAFVMAVIGFVVIQKLADIEI